jgi:hypothetical protein
MSGPLKAGEVNAGTWIMFEVIASSDGMNQVVK